MQLQGEQLIPAARDKVWTALNDPAILEQCIPGCQSLEKFGDDRFEATVTMKIGPVKAKFSGEITLSNIDAPNSYTITGKGKGGVAGFASGGTDVFLEDADGETLLKYNVEAKVGGKLAQIGSRLIDAEAKKLAEDFFEKFSDIVGDEITLDTPIDNVENPPSTAQETSSKGISPIIWTIGLVVIAGALIFAFAQ